MKQAAANENIKDLFKAEIESTIVKSIRVKTILGLGILSFFVYSDLFIRISIGSLYSRIFPMSLALFLLIFSFFTSKKYNLIKTKLYNVFLASLLLMMYAKCVIHAQENDFTPTISGTILVIFLISLDFHANLRNTVIIYFVPTIILGLILSLEFELTREEFLILNNIYPMVILGFTVNRVQKNLRYKNFKANYFLNEKSLEIEAQNKYITDGINYAKRIQKAMLPTKEIFKNNFKDYFIYYNPREIVSGDFYWAVKHKNLILYATADSTGHGVPGAMISMLGISLLNKVTAHKSEFNAAEILEELRNEVKTSLKQVDIRKDIREGMDMALCIINTENLKLQFAGANSSIYIHRNNELSVLKGNRQPIAIWIKERNFTNYEFQLKPDDIIYSFSDGFPDQLTPKGLKYKTKRFKEHLLKIANYPMNEQLEMLKNEFNEWKGHQGVQTDDLLILGIKIKQD